jgi:periplasmic divalent cation tolerance protein
VGEDAPPMLLLCLCTCPDRTSAEALGRALVEERLAACVGLLPGLRSIYRWQGAVETADEVQLLIKTSQARWPALAQRVDELHPYDCPELIAVETVRGLPGYLHWAAEQTGAED